MQFISIEISLFKKLLLGRSFSSVICENTQTYYELSLEMESFILKFQNLDTKKIAVFTSHTNNKTSSRM